MNNQNYIHSCIFVVYLYVVINYNAERIRCLNYNLHIGFNYIIF